MRRKAGAGAAGTAQLLYCAEIRTEPPTSLGAHVAACSLVRQRVGAMVTSWKHRRILQAWVAAAAALAWTVPARAFETFDFDQRYLVQPGFIIKDHSLVKAPDGTLHLFYIKADESLPESERAKALGHATTTDLKHWTFHPDVIPVVPDTWEESFIWAPHVVADGSVWYMFYTGVNRFYAQATGLAVSNDLFNWTKSLDNPIYTPDPSWAAWSPTTWSNCRDPFVLRDAEGIWHLFTTAWTNTSRGAISHAAGPDVASLADLGPLFVHPGPKAWHVLESVNIHEVGGKYNMSFTEQDVGGSSYLSADSLTGPWVYDNRQPLDAGHAPEFFQLDGQWMLSRHTTFIFGGVPRYVIRFDDIDWGNNERPLIVWDDPLADWTLWSGNAFYTQPTFWDNSMERGSDAANFGGNSWIGTCEFFTGPLRAGFPGLAAGDTPTGILRSHTFVVSGNRMTFRIGGGHDPNRLYLALYTADDNVRQRVATGNDSDAMVEMEWNIAPFIGRAAFLEIADLSSDPWGHINVDEIQEYWSMATDAAVPKLGRVVLHANAPNPFNPATRIAFDLPQATQTRLAVFDVRGRLIRTLVDAPLAAGPHQVLWNGLGDDGTVSASGVYFYRLQVGAEKLQRTMQLLK